MSNLPTPDILWEGVAYCYDFSVEFTLLDNGELEVEFTPEYGCGRCYTLPKDKSKELYLAMKDYFENKENK